MTTLDRLVGNLTNDVIDHESLIRGLFEAVCEMANKMRRNDIFLYKEIRKLQGNKLTKAGMDKRLRILEEQEDGSLEALKLFSQRLFKLESRKVDKQGKPSRY